MARSRRALAKIRAKIRAGLGWMGGHMKHEKLGVYPLVMTNIAIENDPVEIVDLPTIDGDFQ